MPWQPDFFIPLDEDDPRNFDRHDPGGERIRFRLNTEPGQIVDYVVQYETPAPGAMQGHNIVLRSDGSHAPHYDLFDQYGATRQVWLDPSLSAAETVNRAVEEIKQNWPAMRNRYYRGLP